MMIRRASLMTALLVLVSLVAIRAADITGKWTASFDTQIGKQEYTYDFVVKDSKLTGKMKSNLGESDVLDGKVDGDKVTFGELLKFEGMEVRDHLRPARSSRPTRSSSRATSQTSPPKSWWQSA